MSQTTKLFLFLLSAMISIIVLMIIFPLQSFAAETIVVAPTEVVFSWGDFLAILLGNLADPQSVAWTVLAGALTWAVAKLPAPLRWSFNLFKVDQLLTHAIQSGLNSTKEAIAGRSLTVDVRNKVVAEAVQYAINNGQAALIEWMGGRAGVEAKIIARLPTVPTGTLL